MGEFDFVIRGDTIADGSGSSLYEGDIGILAGKIVEIGRLGRGKEEIVARGLLVTPGFVDVHTHYHGQATWDDRLASRRAGLCLFFRNEAFFLSLSLAGWPLGRSFVDRVAQAIQGCLVKGLAQCGVHMDRPGHILQQRPHFYALRKLA